jgi:hypothetical protein
MTSSRYCRKLSFVMGLMESVSDGGLPTSSTA